MPRSSSCLVPLPLVAKPAMNVWSPLPARPRAERLLKRAASVVGTPFANYVIVGVSNKNGASRVHRYAEGRIELCHATDAIGVAGDPDLAGQGRDYASGR
jgi:hypothetical protein